MPKKQILNDQDWELPEYRLTVFGSKKTKYCLCIPVINEGERFKNQLVEIRDFADLTDILILDGGSTDGSTEESFLRKNGVRALLVKTGPGKLSAQLRMGYAYALRQGYEGMITIDGNRKDDVADISKFIRELDRGFDYVQGSRFVQGGQVINNPLTRILAIRLIHAPLLSLSARHWYTDTTNGFRAYSQRYLLDPRVKPFRAIFNRYELLAYLTVRANQLGYKSTEIPVTRQYPPSGEVPTKIKDLSSYWDLIATVLKAATGQFNPSP